MKPSQKLYGGVGARERWPTVAYENTDDCVAGTTTGGTGAGVGAQPEMSDSLRTFGAFVQALREHAGLSREEFGDLVRFSKHTVASIEQGRRMPDCDFVERAEAALGNTGALRRAAPYLSRQAGLASWFRQWARLETQAVTLWTYECRVVPGLLQTERYARAVTVSVPPVKDEAQVGKQVTARLERHQFFERRPPIAFSFIVGQTLLERGTGGPDVMRDLLDNLMERSLQFNVELQIMPTSRAGSVRRGTLPFTGRVVSTSPCRRLLAAVETSTPSLSRSTAAPARPSPGRRPARVLREQLRLLTDNVATIP